MLDNDAVTSTAAARQAAADGATPKQRHLVKTFSSNDINMSSFNLFTNDFPRGTSEFFGILRKTELVNGVSTTTDVACCEIRRGDERTYDTTRERRMKLAVLP